MIKHLSISNLAVISHLQVEFGLGLNILTGETGAGKSIILMALGLLLGERASQDMLRTGESKASVEGMFDIEGNTPLENLLGEAGIEAEGPDLIIKREILAGGRAKVFVNNQAATLNLLRAIQPHIIDVHGQGEQQSLLLTSVQANMLDAYAGCLSLRQQVTTAYENVSSIIAQLEESKRSESERLQMLDLLEYQVNEIKSVSPQPNEDSDLETERKILINAEKLTSFSTEVNRLLYDDDDSALSRLSFAARRLDDLSGIDSRFNTQVEQLNSAKYLLEDIALTLRDFAANINYSPERLRFIDDRLVALDRLKRKYGKTLDDVIDYLKSLGIKYGELRDNETYRADLINELKMSLKVYDKAAMSLTKQRRSAAKRLEESLRKDLLEIALEKSRLIIYFNEPAGSVAKLHEIQEVGDDFREIVFTKSGKEAIEFYFSANQGEEPRPLNSVASGGELSRLMLVLKTNIAPTPYPRSLVFDEIDTGIGGRVADAVGVRLKRLAQSNQVICVTHQAQIARYADVHLKVAKIVRGQRTMTQVLPLDNAARVDELSRMIAGSEVTEVVRQHALELVEAISMSH